MSANSINVRATKEVKTLKNTDYVLVGTNDSDIPYKMDVNNINKKISENFISLPANPSNGDALVYNGTDWVAGSVGGGDEWTGGTNYILVKGQATPTENAAELQAAYDLAKTMSPSASNRITVVAATGYYEFPNSSPFTMDTEYIDLVSLTGNTDVIVYTTSSDMNVTVPENIIVDTDNIFVKGIDASKAIWFDNKGTPSLINGAFSISDDLDNLSCHSCVGGDNSFGGGGTASGAFTNCIGGDYSFGGSGDASGAFTNCIGGDYSFGGSGDASGAFTNCIGGDYSFGGAGGIASGTFTNCQGGGGSFGYTGEASGAFTNCIGGDYSFGGAGGTLSGKLYYCRLTSGIFETVSSGGRTYFCVDGDGDPDNQ